MRKLQSAKILAALEAHPAFRAANTILLYHSLGDEVDTHTFIKKWSSEKRILLPVVVGDDLELRIYTGPDDMTTGSYGIEEPTGKVIASDAEKAIMTAFCHVSPQPAKLVSAFLFN